MMTETVYSSRPVFVTLLICAGLTGVAESFNCTTSSACTCEAAGFSINIQQAFDYPVNISDPNDPQKYTYSFSPCTPITSCGPNAEANTAVMCQHNLQTPDGTRDTSLGVVSMFKWDVTSDKNFTITYKGGDDIDEQHGRWTVIHVTIDSHGKDTIQFFEEDTSPSDHHAYKFEMSLKSDEPNIGSGESPIGYIGIVIIILVILALVSYFVIGAAFLYYGKGARGLEAFPNYGFWKELPIYIKDGFCFTISPCRNKMTSKGQYHPL